MTATTAFNSYRLSTTSIRCFRDYVWRTYTGSCLGTTSVAIFGDDLRREHDMRPWLGAGGSYFAVTTILPVSMFYAVFPFFSPISVPPSLAPSFSIESERFNVKRQFFSGL